MSSPRLSIVIPTFNRPRELELTLRSIGGQSLPPVEVVVVDASNNSDTESLLEMIAIEFPAMDFGYFCIPHEQRNASRQRNIGIRKTSGDLVGFLDDDVVLDPQYIQEIARVFESDQAKKVGGVGGLITNLSVSKHFMLDWLESLFGLRVPGALTRLGQNTPHAGQVDKIYRTDWLSGCNCIYRRAVFASHSFEESLGNYSLYEDAAFSSAVSRDWELYIQPHAHIEHLVSSRNRPGSVDLGRRRIRNQYYMFKYCIERKTFKDYLRLACYGLFLVGSMVASWIRRPNRLIIGRLIGTIIGILEVAGGRYPRQSLTVRGVLNDSLVAPDQPATPDGNLFSDS